MHPPPDVAALIAGLRAETWLMDPRALEAMLAITSAGVRVETPTTDLVSADPYAVVDGVAHVALDGVMMRSVPRLLKILGVNAVATGDVQAAIELAAADDRVEAIQLNVNSPGGSVAGVQSLADVVAAVQKPVVAVAGDMMASSAYWVSSQADKIIAGPMSRVGSIAAYSVITDTSQAAASAGTKIHVIRSGELKGSGVPGAPVSDAQIAAEQENVDAIGALFSSAVARGRGLDAEKMASLSTGRDWIGAAALRAGLVDSIGGAAEARSAITALVPPAPGFAADTPKEITMADTKGAAESALQAELEQAKARADRAEARAEMEQAKSRVSAEMVTGIKAKQLKELIEAGVAEGRITPALRGQVESIGAMAIKAGDDPLEAVGPLIKSWPVQTRPATTGTTESPSASAAPVYGAGTKWDAEQLGDFKRLHLAGPAAAERAKQVEWVKPGGEFGLKNGTTGKDIKAYFATGAIELV